MKKRRFESSARDAEMLKKENVMKNKKANKTDDLRSNYIFDYSKAVRGKHFQRLMKEGANVVVLEPDIAKVLRGSAAVNDALRSLLPKRTTSPSRKRAVG
jgi:ketosteroid isomerase-like protein